MKQRIVPLLAAALALTVMLAGCSSQEEAEPLPQGMDTEAVLTAGEAVLDQLLEGGFIVPAGGGLLLLLVQNQTVDELAHLADAPVQVDGGQHGLHRVGLDGGAGPAAAMVLPLAQF